MLPFWFCRNIIWILTAGNMTRDGKEWMPFCRQSIKSSSQFTAPIRITPSNSLATSLHCQQKPFKSCTISPLFRLIIKQKFILRFYFKFIVCCSLQTQEIFLMSPVWYKCQITTYADSKFNFGHLEIKFHNLKLNTDQNLSCCFKMKALCYHYDNITPSSFKPSTIFIEVQNIKLAC